MAATRACAAPDAAGDARLVVVAEHPVRPATGRQRSLVLVDQRREIARAFHGS